MAAKIRVGIVGATVTPGGSGWGANAHVPALNALPDFELKAVCTAHEETAAASQAAFGAELAYHDFEEMIANPDIDLISVVVRVPGHHALVMSALEAGKAVFCEWPLGASVAEAEDMMQMANTRSVATAVGLQARSDAAIMYARELVQQGYVGELVCVNYCGVSQVVSRRGNGRIWQGDRRNGANTLTIAGGHAIDAVNFVVGDFVEVTARLATRIAEWYNTDTGETMKVDSPDWINVAGRLAGGAEVSFLVTTVPSNPSGNRFEIYGREGTLVISGGSPNVGPSKLFGSQGDAPLAPIEPPEHFTLIPASIPAGPARNVAQGYMRLAQAMTSGAPYEPGFGHAVKQHALIAAIERSSAEGRTVRI
ncbi:MAG: Gfo/Idh/MocA family oxidoreductase [Chloroflexota bacterium]